MVIGDRSEGPRMRIWFLFRLRRNGILGLFGGRSCSIIKANMSVGRVDLLGSACSCRTEVEGCDFADDYRFHGCVGLNNLEDMI